MHRVNAARKDFFTVGFCRELKNVMIRCQPLSLTKLAGRVKSLARPVYKTATFTDHSTIRSADHRLGDAPSMELTESLKMAV